MISYYRKSPLQGSVLIMSQKQTHKKTPDRICPKCGATEGVLRVMSYYYCESCHQKDEASKKVSSNTATSSR